MRDDSTSLRAPRNTSQSASSRPNPPKPPANIRIVFFHLHHTSLSTSLNSHYRFLVLHFPRLYFICCLANIIYNSGNKHLNSFILHLGCDMFQFLWIHCLGNKNNIGSGILKICVHLIKSIMCNLYNKVKWNVKLCTLCWLHLVFKICIYVCLTTAYQQK